jgi:hypothetical protein
LPMSKESIEEHLPHSNLEDSVLVFKKISLPPNDCNHGTGDIHLTE